MRYLALRDLLKTPSSVLDEAAQAAYEEGPIATILENMQPEGYWVEPGPGYLPKYTSTVWSVILLGQLGASIQADPRIATACQYILDHALTEYGQFSASGTPGSASAAWPHQAKRLILRKVSQPFPGMTTKSFDYAIIKNDLIHSFH